MRKNGKVTISAPKTVDGGKTWTIDRIVLGAMYPESSSKKDG